ncbi:ABC transporter ATP-binding protein [Streptomyces sp. DSM 41972]|uniref:ABC transporter ATP-binding protein n=1 Tax=Streptomyces althioticus subsp. attaecolombicae TaxID=3075534 RepID=A0ABU3I3V9_9ACTN|nr:ABC transporter ATP-binding protein [Streptomyces sp. DSM 41972]SCD41349.1 ATP-binding cassette, subfamily C [Streptomyces sp. di188]SCD48572.1 ATP-binding cassette, subfamily C [Streptomyces sp. di50b]
MTTAPLADWRPGMRLLRESLHGSRGPALRVALWSVVESAPALAAGWVLATALDRGFLAGRPSTGLAWLVLLAVLYAARALAERALFDPLAQIVEPLRDELVRRVVRGTLGGAVHHGRATDAAGVSRLTSQVDGVRGIVGALLRTARPLAVTLAAAMLGLGALSPVLAVVVGVPVTLSVVVFLVILRAVTRRRLAVVVAEEELATATATVLEAGRDITALGAEEQAADDVRRTADRSVDAVLATARAGAVRVPVVLFGGQLPVLLMLLAAPALVERGAVSAGEVVGAVMYVTGYLIPALNMMTGTVAGMWSQLRVLTSRLVLATAPADVPWPAGGAGETPTGDGPRGTPASGVGGAVSGVGGAVSGGGGMVSGVGGAVSGEGGSASGGGGMVSDAEVAAPAGGRPVQAPAGDGLREASAGEDLVVRGLTFAYGPHAEPVLHGMSLTVPAGDHLAVVGPSGIGKSTLAGLLAGVEAPTAGTVTLGGTPVSPGRIALVPQEAYVFAGTVRENVGYLVPGPDTAALERAVEAVGATDLVARLGGLDAVIDDPAGTLSSGERQLVALARVYASPARVVVLDEATCHLDMAAEAAAEAAFAARPGTLVVIAHRLTTALRARRVLLIDGGRPVLGSHAELLVSSPAYASLAGHWAAPAGAASVAPRTDRDVSVT